MNIIALSNQKGGCGKTTAAINIAASLASLGKKTLLIDLDPQAHATYGLGINNDKIQGSIYNVLTDQPEKRKNSLDGIIIAVDANLDLAPADLLLSTIEQEYSGKEESVSKLNEAIASLSTSYDNIVIDCPPSLGFLTFNALRAASVIIVPVELGSFSLMGVSKLLSMVELLRVKLQHTPKIFALQTMVDMRTRFAKHITEEIRETFGDHMLTGVVRQTISVKESQAKGLPVIKYDKKSKAAIDYLVISQEILNKVSSHAEIVSKKVQAETKSNPANRLHDFVYSGDPAKEVYLVGDFNGWNVSPESLLWQKEEGIWQKRLFLDRGRYHYKFIIDGKWVTDPNNAETESNPYGGVDSVLEVD